MLSEKWERGLRPSECCFPLGGVFSQRDHCGGTGDPEMGGRAVTQALRSERRPEEVTAGKGQPHLPYQGAHGTGRTPPSPPPPPLPAAPFSDGPVPVMCDSGRSSGWEPPRVDSPTQGAIRAGDVLLRPALLRPLLSRHCCSPGSSLAYPLQTPAPESGPHAHKEALSQHLLCLG